MDTLEEDPIPTPQPLASPVIRFLRPACPQLPDGLEALNEMMFPDMVLPEQFYAPSDSASKMRGEVALMYAVLDDALGCFQKSMATAGRRAQRLAQEAEEWFFSDDVCWPFSFVNICAVLGLDPAYIRLGLRQWRQRATKPPKKRRQIVLVRKQLKLSA